MLAALHASEPPRNPTVVVQVELRRPAILLSHRASQHRHSGLANLIPTALVLDRLRLTPRRPPVAVWVEDVYTLGISEIGEGGVIVQRVTRLVESHTLSAARGCISYWSATVESAGRRRKRHAVSPG